MSIETSKKIMAGGNRQHYAAKNTARLRNFLLMIS